MTIFHFDNKPIWLPEFGLPEFNKRKPKKKKSKIKLSNEWKIRYQQAHEHWFKKEYPESYNDGHYKEPSYPQSDKTNGITDVITNYLTWTGNYGNRINSAGRKIKDKYGNEKWIYGSTKNGTSDTHCIINGKHISLEVKNKYTKDTQRSSQIKEQGRVIKAGGIYAIITCVEDFFQWYDKFVVSLW